MYRAYRENKESYASTEPCGTPQPDLVQEKDLLAC